MKKILLFLLLAAPFTMFGQRLSDRLADLLDPTPSFEGLSFSGKELGEYRDLYRQYKDDIDKILGDKSTSRREKESKMRELKKSGQSGSNRQSTPQAKGKVRSKPGSDNGGHAGTQARTPERGSDNGQPTPTTTRRTSTAKPKSKASQAGQGGSTQTRAPQSTTETRPAGTRTGTSQPKSKARRIGG